MSGRYQVIIGTAAVALGTAIAGWIAPVAWGVLAGMLWSRERPARHAAVASGLGWGLLLVGQTLAGYPVAALASRLAGVFGMPAVVLVALTMSYAALLSGTAAYLVSGLVRHRRAVVTAHER